MMFIKFLTNFRKNREHVLPGTEDSIPDSEAFELIENGSAEPANRWARTRYAQMKAAKIAATPPEGPDIRELYVSAPEVEVKRVLTLKR